MSTEAPTAAPEIEEQEAHQDADAIRAEVEGMDVGDFPKSDEQRTLCRFMRLRSQLAMEHTRIADQMTAMLKGLESRIDGLDYLFLPVVKPIVEDMLKGGKAKSIKTPWGTAGFRSSQPKLEITDEPALRQAASAADDEALASVLVMEWSVSKSKLNEYFKSTGELPSGVELVPAAEKFYVK